MKRKTLDFELQSRVRRYLEYTMTNESNLEEENKILLKLTKSLRNEVLLEAFGKYIDNVPFFKKNFTKETLENIVLSLKELKFSPEEFIYHVIVLCYQFSTNCVLFYHQFKYQGSELKSILF